MDLTRGKRGLSQWFQKVGGSSHLRDDSTNLRGVEEKGIDAGEEGVISVVSVGWRISSLYS